MAPHDRDAALRIVTERDGTWSLDVRTGSLEVDEASWRMLGWDPRSPALPPWRSLLLPEDEGLLWSAVNAVLTGAPAAAYAVRLRSADGGWHPVLGRVAIAERGAGGAATRLTGTHAVVATTGAGPPSGTIASRDPILEAIPDVMLILSPDTTIMAVHAGALAASRGAANALTGARFEEALPRASAELVRESLRDVLRTGELQVVEITWAFDGRPRRFDLRLARVTPLTALALLQDVTDRAETASFLERISRAVPGIVYLYSRWPDGREAYLYLNNAAERLLGVPAAEIWADPKKAWRHLHPEDVAALEEAIQRSYRTGVTMDQQFRVRLPEGQRWLRAQAVPSPREADGSVTWAGVMLDVSRERAAEEEQRLLAERTARAERLEQLGLMAGGIAHDFNNLLVGVFGSAAQLRDELGPEHPSVPLAVEIEQAAHRMADITRQMLHFSGKNPAPARRIDLGHAVRESLALVQASIGGGARLELRLGSGGPDVLIDPGQITQVLANLVLNAADAIGTGHGTIWVETGTVEATARDLVDVLWGTQLWPGRYATLVVRDDGPGMSNDVSARVFEPFYTTKPGGRGLGLPVVAGIVKRAGGAVHVESEPGRGTRIRVLLPIAEPLEAEPAARRAVAPRGGALVLVVDDEPHVRSVAKRILEKAGHRVVVAEDGEVALTIVRESAVQVALVDATMPGMSGAEVLGALAAMKPGLPLVLMSGYARDEVRDAAQRAAAGFVAKPFTPEDLRQAVRAALELGVSG
jgi:signal transduction histidine kinase/CheY-like chemotaxis protein